MKNNSARSDSLPETGYVRQAQLIPAIFPFRLDDVTEGEGRNLSPKSD